MNLCKSRCLPALLGSPFQLFILLLLASAQVRTAGAQTGTFIDRNQPTDLRVASYNVLWNRIFPDQYPSQAAKFERVVNAIDADVWNLQEIGPNDPTAADVVSLMNTIAPLGGGASWYGHQSWDNVIVSKYPLIFTGTDTIPEPSSTSVAMAYVVLPDNQFASDFYFMNNHFKCCGSVGSSEDIKRQQQADALVNWMRDARTLGGFFNLPADTPMAVVGDLNIVGSQQPLNTIIDGNIIYEGIYGSDSPPDWDGTNLTNANPLHNGTGPSNYTWRSGGSTSVLDYVLYTDSVVDVGNSFVLNTVSMSAADRAATGLQTYDITASSSTTYYDHLPLVVDFRFPALNYADSDFDQSGYVDSADLATWQAGFGSGTNQAQGDADGDGDVDGFDLLKWQREFSPASPSLALIPEPGTFSLLLASGLALLIRRR